MMLSFFYICFGVGVGYTLIAFLLGGISDVAHLSADIHVDANISPLKPVIIASFITVFGGIGSLLVRLGIPIFAVFGIATIVGLVVSYLMFTFVIMPLTKAQSTSAIDQDSLIGLPAKVTLLIPQGKYGKIIYSVNGNTYSAPAKSEDGSEIAAYEKVEIMYIKKNTFYVSKYKHKQ